MIIHHQRHPLIRKEEVSLTYIYGSNTFGTMKNIFGTDVDRANEC